MDIPCVAEVEHVPGMPVILTVPGACAEAMRSEGDRRFPRETGGILAGRWTSATQAIVTHIIGPGPRARHGLRRFTPDTEWQTTELASAWATAPGLEYLGDWHTHPLGSAAPSGLDRAATDQIAGYAPARNSRPIIAILSLGLSGRSELGAFVLLEGKLTPMTVVSRESASGPRFGIPRRRR